MICTGALTVSYLRDLFLIARRMLINIVMSRRLLKYECRLVKDPQLSIHSTALPSCSESTLTQALSRCIIKCGGSVKEESHAVCLNMFDCYGETTLMHAAAINDTKLVRCDFDFDFDFLM